jgi:hypothetical protein
MNSPRLVFSLSKIEEMVKSRIISNRLIPAIMVPIIVSQFLKDGGSFIVSGFKGSDEVKIEKYWINLNPFGKYLKKKTLS